MATDGVLAEHLLKACAPPRGESSFGPGVTKVSQPQDFCFYSRWTQTTLSGSAALTHDFAEADQRNGAGIKHFLYLKWESHRQQRPTCWRHEMVGGSSLKTIDFKTKPKKHKNPPNTLLDAITAPYKRARSGAGGWMLRDTHPATHPASLSILPSPSKSLWSLVTCILHQNVMFPCACCSLFTSRLVRQCLPVNICTGKNGARSGQHFPEAKKR